MAAPITIFTDRDGDRLSVTPRNEAGNTTPDPIITVTYLPGTKGELSRSVIFKENEVPPIVVKMVGSLHLHMDQVLEIINGLGSLLDADIDVKFREE